MSLVSADDTFAMAHGCEESRPDKSFPLLRLATGIRYCDVPTVDRLVLTNDWGTACCSSSCHFFPDPVYDGLCTCMSLGGGWAGLASHRQSLRVKSLSES